MRNVIDNIKTLFSDGRQQGSRDPSVIRHAEIEIIRVTVKRAVLVMWLLVIFEICLIAFYDLPAIIKAESISASSSLYLIVHICIMAVGLSSLFLLRLTGRSRQHHEEKLRFFNFLIFLTPLSIMILLAFISVLDQSSTGSISAFTVNIMIVAVMILVKPPKNLILFTVPYAVFLTGLIMNQPDKAVMGNNIVNGTVFYICILALSTLFYYNQRSIIINNILLKKANKKLKDISNIDSLTGLYNRRYLDSIMQRELSHMKRYNENCAFILIDIDNFKVLNDTFGHPAGDRILSEFSSILKDSIRESDIAVRMGGEEFLLLLFNNDTKSVIPKAGELLDRISSHTFDAKNGSDITLTASIGISELSGYTPDDYLQAYQRADKAVYRAKENGRNRIEIA